MKVPRPSWRVSVVIAGLLLAPASCSDDSKHATGPVLQTITVTGPTATGRDGTDRVESSRRLREGDWHCVVAAFDGPEEELSVTVMPARAWTVPSRSVRRSGV